MENKIIVIFIFSLVCFHIANAQSGTLDTSFNASGIITTNYGSLNDFASAIAVQPDGRIVIAGQAQVSGNNHQFMLGRYLTYGMIDSSFGTNGMVFTNFGNSFDGATAVTVQPDGKIVAVGYVAPSYSFAVARYDTDGSLDTTFSNTGMVITTMGGMGATSVALQTDGKIVVAGSSGLNFGLVRYNIDGSLDTIFGINGKVSTSFLGSGSAYGVAIQPDGKIVAGGTITNAGTGADFAIARYDSLGVLDTTFNTTGKFVVDIGENISDQARALALQSDGKILLAGYTSTITQDFAIIRVTSNGTLDSPFGTNGIQTFDINSADNYLTCMTVQSDDKALLSGINYYGSLDEILLIRLDSIGSLDNIFGNGGKVITHISNLYDESYAIALQTDGKILLGGTAQFLSDVDAAVLRYNNDTQVGINEILLLNHHIQVYPNPTNELINLSFLLEKDANFTLILTDIQGKEINTFFKNKIFSKGYHLEQLKINKTVRHGIYFILLNDYTGRNRFHAKIVID